ncbi:MAG TPA: RNA-binding protein [bacterium]|nr:RNA-binding protein [bacterium]
MNIYVGNISRDVTQDELRDAFKAYGEVTNVNIIADKFSGQSRGFGFVEMPAAAEAMAAISALNNQDLKGRPLNVNEARAREEKPRRGGGGSFGRNSW